ncbi:hypothetical protein Tco_0596169 [Tanacetum coccineum]
MIMMWIMRRGIDGDNEQGIDYGNEGDNEIGSDKDYDRDNEINNDMGSDEMGNDHSIEMVADQGDEMGSEHGGVEEEFSDHADDNIVDEEHIIDELEVNMEGFRFTVDDDLVLETLHPEVNVIENDLEVIYFDSFDSDIGDDSDSERRAALRKLKKEGKQNAAKSRITNYFFVGQEFPNKEEAKKRINGESQKGITSKEIVLASDMLNIQKGNSVVKGTNKGKKVIQHEDEDNKCPWTLYIHYETNSQKWVVRTFKDEHKCMLSRKIKACTSSFLTSHVVDLIQLNPQMPTKAIQDQMQKQLQVSVSIHKAFRAKAKAETFLKGDAQVQYSLLRDYLIELQKCNPNTTVKLDCYRKENHECTTRVFRRIYVCLGPLKEGFKAGGRELLGLDGAFMKGQYPGQLLTAVGVDGNNGIYPVAYGIVESESLDSWKWFLTQLGDDLELYNNSNFTFINDRQKGLLPAIKSLFPAAEHRYCVRHINQNMNLQWKGGVFKDLLWRAATSTTAYFDKAMDELKAYNIKAYEWLKKIRAENWSRSHFSGPLTPAATKIINKIKEASVNYIVDWNGLDLYQEVSGIPCKRVVACIHDMADHDMDVGLPEAWVHPAYKLETWSVN